MAGYYDSSLLLAAALGQFAAADYADAWDGEVVRVASLLLRIECVVALRRAAVAGGQKPDGRWVRARLSAVAPFLDAVTTQAVDDRIEEIVRAEPRLAQCRALDAVHLATALYLRDFLDEPLRVCSLDKRLRAAAVDLGFEVRPQAMPVGLR